MMSSCNTTREAISTMSSVYHRAMTHRRDDKIDSAQQGQGRTRRVLRASTKVEPRLRHKNQEIMASGPDLCLPVARKRHLREG
jgi:hypothetical protein